MRNYPEWVFSFMAVTSQGGVSVPTNSLWVGAEIEYALNDSGAVVVFCDGERAAHVLPLCQQGKLPSVRAVIVCRDKDNVATRWKGALPVRSRVRVLSFDDVMQACRAPPCLAPQHPSDPDSNAIIMYTSGTTSSLRASCPPTAMSSITALGFLLPCPREGNHASLDEEGEGVRKEHALMAKLKKKTGGQSNLQPSILCPVPLFHAAGTHVIFLISFFSGVLVLMHNGTL